MINRLNIARGIKCVLVKMDGLLGIQGYDVLHDHFWYDQTFLSTTKE